MLMKLLKYDFRESGRLLLPILGGVLLLSMFGKFLLATNIYSVLPDVIQVFSVMTYVLIIFACCVGAPIYFIIFFYRGFYTNKGYITHTLPVTTNQKLLSKIITSFVLELLTYAVCFLSLLILIWKWDYFNRFIDALPELYSGCKAYMGVNLYSFIAVTGIVAIIGMLCQLLTCFAAISLGQILPSHRILGSIGAYFVLYCFNQAIGIFMIAISSLFTRWSDTIQYHWWESLSMGQGIYAFYGIFGSIALIECILFYLICHYMMNKKLNLS